VKIVINTCFGGFSLSDDALEALESGAHPAVLAYIEAVGRGEKKDWHHVEIARDDRMLVNVVENLGSERASGRHASLKVVEIPDGVEWGIAEYDGQEHVAEKHRSWA
jgi:hypothetical protein